MPSISFCMTTRGYLPRVHGLLTLVRPYVDEIVLAVDSAGNLDALEACAGLADKRLTFEYADSPARYIGWVQHQCTGDWLLRLDDDEIPSRALLDALPELVADRRPTHYGLSRRWLHPDPGTYVLSPPWQPDYQLRLVRNVPGMWRFNGAVHTDATVLGERRLVDLPIYHADLLLLDVDARRRKAEGYERLRPEHMTEGVSVNAIYVPEDWEALATERVPSADRPLIDAVLDAPPAPPRSGEDAGAPVVHASFAEVDAFNSTRTIAEDAYRARIEFVRPVVRVPAGIVREQEVRVENLGDDRWPWGPDAEPLIRLGYRWHAAGTGEVLGEGPRTPFTESVVPGAATLQKLTVEIPAHPGRYVLEVDVVHEHVRWFGCEARLEVEVVEPGAAPGPERGGLRGYLRQAREHGIGPGRGLRMYRAWAASLDPQRTPLSDRRPWLTFAAQHALEATLRPGMRVCEFGAGGSTPFLLERGADLTTVEYDGDWAERVGDVVPAARSAAWTVEVAPPEPDPASRVADPSDPGGYVSASPAFLGFSFHAYANALERFDEEALDIVLVTGRARPSCLRHALAKVRRGGLLVLDHAERSWYGPALALAAGAGWERQDHGGPGPYAERFWQTAILRRGR
jgi:hypothetical protein